MYLSACRPICLSANLSTFLAVLRGMQDLSSPQPGIEPVPPAVEAWSPNHWTAREFPCILLFKMNIL